MDLDTIAKALQKVGLILLSHQLLALVVPEGYTLNQIAEAVEKSGNKKYPLVRRIFYPKCRMKALLANGGQISQIIESDSRPRIVDNTVWKVISSPATHNLHQ